MKMEKESDEELAEKSADSINMNRSDLSARHKQILTNMDIGVEYSTEQIAEKIGLKGPRTRQLLNELVNKELLACILRLLIEKHMIPISSRKSKAFIGQKSHRLLCYL